MALPRFPVDAPSLQPFLNPIHSERVLEINADHEILEVLKAALAEDKEKLDTYAQLLYDQALLIEGMPIDDPVRFSTEVCKLMK